MKFHFYKSELALRFTSSFILHQVLLFCFISLPAIFFFYVFKMEPNQTNYNILAWITLALYVIYCLFYGYYVAYPMIDIISKIKILSRGEFLEVRSVRRFSPFSSHLYREVYRNLAELSKNLKQNERQRAEFEKMRGEWVAGVTHDLKTPLSYIKGYSEMLLSEDYSWTEEEKKEFLQIVQQNTSHLEGLVKDLGMAFHMDEMGSLPMEKQTVHLTELLRQSLAEIANLPESKQSHFEWMGDEKELSIQGDPKLLKRAFLNVLSNSVVHNDAPVKVTVQLEDKGQNILLTIRDNGQGIKEEDLIHLFDRYYRGTNTRQDVNATGLGLAITKQIIGAHHGKIHVSSQENKFTQFEILLPKDIS